VLDVIEESIFRQPGMPGADPFNLEAYRELVLLYHIAREITPAAPAERKVGATGFPDTALQPLNALDAPDSAVRDSGYSPHDMLLVPPASSRLGLDIDLTEPTSPPRAPSRAADTPAAALRAAMSSGLAPLEFPVPFSSAGPAQARRQEEPDLDFSLDAEPPQAAVEGSGGDETHVLPAGDGARELPPLDFDISAFDEAHEPPKRKHGS
jgi:hypothetical protein